MRVGVDEEALRLAASEVDRAATAVAALASTRLTGWATAIGLAMPGSRSAEVARRVAADLDRAIQDLALDLVVTAGALRGAGARYADTEDGVAAGVAGGAGTDADRRPEKGVGTAAEVVAIPPGARGAA